MMRTVRFHENGEADVSGVEESPSPARDGDAPVRVNATIDGKRAVAAGGE